ncbi:MAG TPA: hypothetical protein VER55_13195 [Ardenticatenaceae bacterium]|nr:hypothetical protein [Ardenticatenaceae bacterium]
MGRPIHDVHGYVRQVTYEPATGVWQVDGSKAIAVPHFLTERERGQEGMWALATPTTEVRGAQTWEMFVFRKDDLELLRQETAAVTR